VSLWLYFDFCPSGGCCRGLPPVLAAEPPLGEPETERSDAIKESVNAGVSAHGTLLSTTYYGMVHPLPLPYPTSPSRA
jgi:hypothetical protein